MTSLPFIGRPFLVRLNTGIRQAVGHSDFQYRTGVAVPLRASDANGFPGPDDSAQLELVEDRLDAALSANRNSILVAVISGRGMRKFLFYSQDADETHEKLLRLESEISSHESQYYVALDPKWAGYRQFA